MQTNLLIQIHWTDFESYPGLIYHDGISIVEHAKKHFDKIVLVCGDVPENKVVQEFARKKY